MKFRDKRRVIAQFKKQLNELYSQGTHILVLFGMYLGFLSRFADRPKTPDKYRLSLWTHWQIKDMEMSIWNAKIDVTKVILETAWLYGRREGKTRGLTIVAVFFTLLNYQVAWRAPHGEQLKKASFWFSSNPFVERVMLQTDNTIRVYKSFNISIAPITTGRVTGSDCDILIIDEGGWIPTRLQAYELYLAARPMVSNSIFKHIIHASTAARDTAFQHAWDGIKEMEVELDVILTSIHTCEDCEWISEEFIEQESKIYPKWYIELNYYCMWTVPYGAVFERIYEVSDPKSPVSQERLYQILATHAGVDHNAGDRSNPHYIVTTTFDNNFFYVLDEYPFYGTKDDMSGLGFLFDDKFRHVSMEIEDGLYNIQFTDQEKSMGLAVIYYAWTKEEKMTRVQELRNRFIVIDKIRAPLTYKNILNAGYNKASKFVELEKRTDQHGLDCILHSYHPSSGGMQVYAKTQHAPMKRSFKKYERTLRV